MLQMVVLRKFALVVSIAFAAGCAGEQMAPTSPSSAEAETEAADTSAPCPKPGYSAVPDGVMIGHDYVVRSERFYSSKGGTERRKTSIELLDGNATQVAEAAVAAYVAQGFRRVEVPDRADGTQRLAVRKKGVGRINISAADNTGGNPSHPRSVGVVAFDWPVEVAVDAAKVDMAAEPAS